MYVRLWHFLVPVLDFDFCLQKLLLRLLPEASFWISSRSEFCKILESWRYWVSSQHVYTKMFSLTCLTFICRFRFCFKNILKQIIEDWRKERSPTTRKLATIQSSFLITCKFSCLTVAKSSVFSQNLHELKSTCLALNW